MAGSGTVFLVDTAEDDTSAVTSLRWFWNPVEIMLLGS
jgi:hypothetical protein